MKVTKQLLEKVRTIKLEAGMHHDAFKADKPFMALLEDYAIQKGLEPTIYHGKSAMQRVNEKRIAMSLGKVPEPNMLEVFLMAYNIRAFGEVTDRISNMFVSNNTSVLWPEWISSVIYADQLKASLVEMLVSAVLLVDGIQYSKLSITDSEDALELKQTAPGTKFPTTEVQLGKTTKSLTKFGRILKYEYEVLKNKTFADFRTVVLSRISQYIGVSKTKRLITALISGDGVDDGLLSDNIETTTVTTAIDQDDIIKLLTATDAEYQINHIIAQTAMMRKYWGRLTQMTNPAAQKAQIGVPFPMEHRADYSELTADYILGLDSTQALAWMTNDYAVMEESWNVITTQNVETVISMYGDPAVLNNKAISALDVNHS